MEQLVEWKGMLLIITPEQQMENGTVLDKLGGMINLYKGGRVGRGMGPFSLYFTKSTGLWWIVTKNNSFFTTGS